MNSSEFICKMCSQSKLSKDGLRAYCKKTGKGVSSMSVCEWFAPYETLENIVLPVNKYPNLTLFTFNGCGVGFSGKFNRSGYEYDTVRYVKVLFLPVIPIDAYRVYNLGLSNNSPVIREFIVIDKIPLKFLYIRKTLTITISIVVIILLLWALLTFMITRGTLN
ncbi:MAG: hypothetical protein QMB47_02685 [Bacteroidales bacterium]|jgi:hypothetical protein